MRIQLFIYSIIVIGLFSIFSCKKQTCENCNFYVVDARGNNTLQITKETFNQYYPTVDWCDALKTFDGYEFKNADSVVTGNLNKVCK
jgi:hypothetical protein